MRWKWPDEVVEWLRANVPGRTTKEVTVLINQQGFDEKYGMIFTEETIKGAKSRYKIRSGTGPTKIAILLNEKFGRNYTPNQMKAYYKNHDLNSGLTGYFLKGNVPANKGKKMSLEQYEKCKATMFKKGSVPPNHMEVGELTHTTDGYLVRKVREIGIQQERFEFVHRAEWEKHNGPIPEGKMVSFLDGDKDNCDISNLVLIDNCENLELNRSKLRFENPEFTKAGVAVAKLKVATARRKKGMKRC